MFKCCLQFTHLNGQRVFGFVFLVVGFFCLIGFGFVLFFFNTIHLKLKKKILHENGALTFNEDKRGISRIPIWYSRTVILEILVCPELLL